MSLFDYDTNKKCSNCKTEDYLIEDSSQASLVCTKCGLEILSRMVSSGKDWNNYESGVNNSRVSSIDTQNPYATCGTYIKPGTFISYGFNPDGTQKRFDLGKLHARIVYTSKQRSYDSVAKEFEKLSEDLPQKVIDTAKRYWGKIMDGNIHRGSNRKGIIASCILYSCYENKCSRTRNNIANIMGIDKECITKGEYLFIDMVKKTDVEYVLKLSSDIEDMFFRYINNFGLSCINFEHKKMCIELYKKYKNYFLNMKPESVIGGIICYVLKEKEKMKKPTKRTICNIVGVSDPTINKALKKIKELENKIN